MVKHTIAIGIYAFEQLGCGANVAELHGSWKANCSIANFKEPLELIHEIMDNHVPSWDNTTQFMFISPTYNLGL